MTTKAPKFAPITGEAALAMRQKTGTSQTQIPRPVQMLLRIAYGTKAQATKQIEALRPSGGAEASEETAS